MLFEEFSIFFHLFPICFQLILISFNFHEESNIFTFLIILDIQIPLVSFERNEHLRERDFLDEFSWKLSISASNNIQRTWEETSLIIFNRTSRLLFLLSINEILESCDNSNWVRKEIFFINFWNYQFDCRNISFLFYKQIEFEKIINARLRKNQLNFPSREYEIYFQFSFDQFIHKKMGYI